MYFHLSSVVYLTIVVEVKYETFNEKIGFDDGGSIPTDSWRMQFQ